MRVPAKIIFGWLLLGATVFYAIAVVAAERSPESIAFLLLLFAASMALLKPKSKKAMRKRFDWGEFVLGLGVAAGLSFAFFTMAIGVIFGTMTGSGESDGSVTPLAIVLALTVFGMAVWAHVNGDRALLVGLLGMYGLITVVTRGQGTGVSNNDFDPNRPGFPIAYGLILILVAIMYTWLTARAEDAEEGEGSDEDEATSGDMSSAGPETVGPVQGIPLSDPTRATPSVLGSAEPLLQRSKGWVIPLIILLAGMVAMFGACVVQVWDYY